MILTLLVAILYLVILCLTWLADKRAKRMDVEANYRRAEAIAKRMALIERMETYGCR